MLEKHVLKDKLSAFERSATIRFEPVVNFFNDCKQATIVANEADPLKLREFFKKVGSNPLVRDRVFTFAPRFLFALVPKIPEKIRQGAGGAEGGFQGGIPPCPPHSAIPSPFFADSATFTFLRRRRDSNPRCLFKGHTSLAKRYIRPL